MADTGFRFPTTTGEDYNQWTNPSNAFSSNDNRTDTTVANNKQDYYTFGFSLPPMGNINGIEVRVEAAGSLFNSTTIGVELSWDGGATYTAAGKSFSVAAGAADALYTLGGSADVWGHTFTFAQMSDSNFRLRINANVIDPDVPRSAQIDGIEVKVYYTETTTTSTSQSTSTSSTSTSQSTSTSHSTSTSISTSSTSTSLSTSSTSTSQSTSTSFSTSSTSSSTSTSFSTSTSTSTTLPPDPATVSRIFIRTESVSRIW